MGKQLKRLLRSGTDEKTLASKLVDLFRSKPQQFTEFLSRTQVTVFHWLLEHGKYDTLKILLEYPDIASHAWGMSTNRQTLLHYAARFCHSNIEFLLWLIQKNPAMLNAQDTDLNTPLHHAAMTRNTAAIICFMGNPITDRRLENKLHQFPEHLLPTDSPLESLITDSTHLNTLIVPRYDGQVSANLFAVSTLRLQANFSGLYKPASPRRAVSRYIEAGSPRTTLSTASSSSSVDSISTSLYSSESPRPDTALRIGPEDSLLSEKNQEILTPPWEVLEQKIMSSPSPAATVSSMMQTLEPDVVQLFRSTEIQKQNIWEGFAHAINRFWLRPKALPDTVEDPDYSGIPKPLLPLAESLWQMAKKLYIAGDNPSRRIAFDAQSSLLQGLGIQATADPVSVLTCCRRLTAQTENPRIRGAMICIVYHVINTCPLSWIMPGTEGKFQLHFFLKLINPNKSPAESQKMHSLFHKHLSKILENRTGYEMHPLMVRYRELANLQGKLSPETDLEALVDIMLDPDHPENRASILKLAHDIRALSRKCWQEFTVDDIREYCDGKASPRLKFMISWFENLNDILILKTLRHPKRTGGAIQSLVRLAQNLAGWDGPDSPDFHGLMCISGVLTNRAVDRLRKSFFPLPEALQAINTKLAELLNQEHNYLWMRMVEQTQPDTTPYTGLMTTDLTFAKQGACNGVELTELRGNVILRISRLQSVLGPARLPFYTNILDVLTLRANTEAEAEAMVEAIAMAKAAEAWARGAETRAEAAEARAAAAKAMTEAEGKTKSEARAEAKARAKVEVKATAVAKSTAEARAVAEAKAAAAEVRAEAKAKMYDKLSGRFKPWNTDSITLPDAFPEASETILTLSEDYIPFNLIPLVTGTPGSTAARALAILHWGHAILTRIIRSPDLQPTADQIAGLHACMASILLIYNGYSKDGLLEAEPGPERVEDITRTTMPPGIRIVDISRRIGDALPELPPELRPQQSIFLRTVARIGRHPRTLWAPPPASTESMPASTSTGLHPSASTVGYS